jgi:hypothetical protein
MYGIFKQLNKENIYKYIDSYNIFIQYCNGFEQLNKAFKSPLRDDDEKPSAFIIFYEGDLLFKDFGKGSYRAIDFVMALYNLNYYEALQKINCDFNLKLGNDYDPNYTETIHLKKPNDEFIEKKPCIIIIKKRPYTDLDKQYWINNYHIKENTLTSFNVVPISHFSINDYLYFSEPLSYSYNYYWEKDIFRRKIYQPLSYNKWYSNGGLIVQGEGMLPKKGGLLIITSSLKDVMTLYELGYTAIAPTSESSFVPEKYFYKQSGRFKKIILFMDSDVPGMQSNEKLSKKWNLNYVSIPQGYGTKDISDFVKKYGQLEAIKMLYRIIII